MARGEKSLGLPSAEKSRGGGGKAVLDERRARHAAGVAQVDDQGKISAVEPHVSDDVPVVRARRIVSALVLSSR